MATVNTCSPSAESNMQQNIDFVWHAALNQIERDSTEIVVPSAMAETIGKHGINVIVGRFSNIINHSVSVFQVSPPGVVRLMRTPPGAVGALNIDLHEVPVPSTRAVKARNPASKVAKDRLTKIPRPPNAFILYRKKHHSQIKAKNPGKHNNDISVIIGKMWKNESAATKESFKQDAEKAKSKLMEEHPEYQYQPRRSSDVRRRRRLAARVTSRPAPQCVPSFTPSENGKQIEYIYEPGQLGLLDQMVEKHNNSCTTNRIPVDGNPRIVSVPSPEAEDDYTYHEAQIDFQGIAADIAANERALADLSNAPNPSLGLPTMHPANATGPNFNNGLATKYMPSIYPWQSISEDQRQPDLSSDWGKFIENSNAGLEDLTAFVGDGNANLEDFSKFINYDPEELIAENKELAE